MFFLQHEALQGAQDKAEPGRMNFSAVSREASHPRRGIQQFSILVRTAEEEAILMAMNSGVLNAFQDKNYTSIFDLNYRIFDFFFSIVLKLVQMSSLPSCEPGLVNRTDLLGIPV